MKGDSSVFLKDEQNLNCLFSFKSHVYVQGRCYGDHGDYHGDLRNLSTISKHSANMQAQCHKLFFSSTDSVLHLVPLMRPHLQRIIFKLSGLPIILLHFGFDV